MKKKLFGFMAVMALTGALVTGCGNKADETETAATTPVATEAAPTEAVETEAVETEAVETEAVETGAVETEEETVAAE